MSTTTFVSNLASEKACVSGVFKWCEGSAVAVLERELIEQQANQFAQLEKATAEKIQISAFSNPAIDLKIPMASAVSTIQRDQRNSKPSFTFSNSYAFLK